MRKTITIYTIMLIMMASFALAKTHYINTDADTNDVSIGNNNQIYVDNTGQYVGFGLTSDILTSGINASIHSRGANNTIYNDRLNTAYSGGGDMHTSTSQTYAYSTQLGGGGGYTTDQGKGGEAGGIFIGGDGGTSYGGGGAGIVAIGGDASTVSGAGAGIYARPGIGAADQNGIVAAGFFDGIGREHALLAMNGSVGIGTVEPASALSVISDDISNPAIFAEGYNYGVYGNATGSSDSVGVYGDGGAMGDGVAGYGTYGVKGTGLSRGVKGSVSGSPNKYGELGSSNWGAYGQYTSNLYGYLGGSDYAVFGTKSPSTFGYIGGDYVSVYGLGNSTSYGVYGDNSAYTGVVSNGSLEVEFGGLCIDSGSNCGSSTAGDGDMVVNDGSMCIGDGGCTAPTGDGRLNVTQTSASNEFTIRGEAAYNAYGYVGVQGSTDFDGVTTADWTGQEIGIAGISVGSSDTDNFGVIGHSNDVGVRGECSSSLTDYAELGDCGNNYGIYASGTSYAAYLNGKLYVGTMIGKSADYQYVVVDSTANSGEFYYRSSSNRTKGNITDLEDDFSKILSATPREWIDTNSGHRGIGFVAEEFEEIGLQELVSYNGSGVPTDVKYEMVPLYLLEVLKTQTSMIEKQENRIKELESKLLDIEARLEDIEDTEK